MTVDSMTFLFVRDMARHASHSALPNAPVVDDAGDRPSWRIRLTAARMRLAALVWPGELIVAPGMRDPAPAGC